jgi:hypothetical protein
MAAAVAELFQEFHRRVRRVFANGLRASSCAASSTSVVVPRSGSRASHRPSPAVRNARHVQIQRPEVVERQRAAE